MTDAAPTSQGLPRRRVRQATLVTYALTEQDVYELAERGRLFAVLDAADAPGVFELLADEEVVTEELFASDADPALSFSAPYLTPLDEQVLARLRETVWSDEWGLLIETDIPLAVLQRHLRRFLLVDHPSGKTVYFRMYDPRVLRRFLPICTGWELAEIFGRIEAYITREDDDSFTRHAIAATPTQGVGVKTDSADFPTGAAPRLVLRDEHLKAFSAE